MYKLYLSIFGHRAFRVWSKMRCDISHSTNVEAIHTKTGSRRQNTSTLHVLDVAPSLWHRRVCGQVVHESPSNVALSTARSGTYAGLLEWPHPAVHFSTPNAQVSCRSGPLAKRLCIQSKRIVDRGCKARHNVASARNPSRVAENRSLVALRLTLP